MSLYDYKASQKLEAQDVPFDALLMAAMHKADTDNLAQLVAGWPELWAELRARYEAPGGVLPGEITPDAR
ncbi:MAG: hypothetical protein ACK4N5_07930 [Myxococcales bacterium]